MGPQSPVSGAGRLGLKLSMISYGKPLVIVAATSLEPHGALEWT